ncbi:MAG TPA: hypothetical protein PK514_08780 [Spirochaetota bacterium]|nr:hypothetical protein [Spirochaetota bacterium]
MKRISPVIVLCCALPAILLCWNLLTSGDAKWLQVETPLFAAKGESYRVRVTLTSPESGSYLGADIHGMNEKKISTGYLSGGRQIQVSADKKVYEFLITVPLNKNPAYIFPVIILSRDGTWKGRISAADTEPVPVTLSGSRNEFLKLEFKRARDTAQQATVAKPESHALGIAISLLWMAAALTAALFRKQFMSGWIAPAAAVSSLWEVLNSSTAISSIMRMAAQGSGLYSDRRIPQQLLTLTIILVFMIAAIYLLSSSRELYRVLSWICITAYWGVNLLQVFSLHETDRLLSVNIRGLQAGQLIKLAAAVICILLLLARRKK